MKRLSLYSRLALAAVIAVGASFFSSCKPDLVAPNAPQDFAALRVLNFTSSDTTYSTAPVDVYWYPVGQTSDSIANVNNLQYGQASVYTNNISADPNGTTYHIVVRPVRSHDKIDTQQDIVLKAGHRYSYVLYTDPNNTTSWTGTLVEDGAPTPSGDPAKGTYVRFMNVQPNSHLTAAVNSIFGDQIAPSSGIDYRSTSDYVYLGSALDTSYSFYVFDPSNPDSIVGKIAFQSFAPGSYHTVVFAGDLTRTAPHNPDGDALDSLRVRVLDDNGIGNEETSPIPQSIRYFIVNAMIPDEAPGNAPWWAFEVANDANPSHHGFTFDPAPSFSPVPNYGAVNADGIQNVYFGSTTLSTWVNVKGFQVADANGSSPKLIFDVHAQRTNMSSDNGYALIFFDTIPAEGKKNDSSGLGRVMTTVEVTDQPTPGAATVIFVNATAPSTRWIATNPANTASFYVNGTKVSFGGTLGKSITQTYDAGQDLNITTKLGGTSNSVDGPSFTLPNAQANAIYLVVLEGQRSDGNRSDGSPVQWPSQLKVYRVNPPPGQ